MDIVICVSCEGYGWFDEDDGVDCDWCSGVGYVYRDDKHIDHRIPQSDFGKVADRLEQLDTQRMKEMGYTGSAKKPWEQAIRKGTKGGEKPDLNDKEE